MSQPKNPKIPNLEQITPYDIDSLLAVPAGEERIRRFLANMAGEEKKPGQKSWMGEILPCLSIASSAPASASRGPTVVCRFEVAHIHSNGIGNMQGGCISTVFDYTTSLALGLISQPGFWFFLGVTRTLTITVLRPVSVGEVVLIEGEVVNAGKRLAHLRATMRRESDGVLMAVCEHDKVNSDPPAKLFRAAKGSKM